MGLQGARGGGDLPGPTPANSVGGRTVTRIPWQRDGVAVKLRGLFARNVAVSEWSDFTDIWRTNMNRRSVLFSLSASAAVLLALAGPGQAPAPRAVVSLSAAHHNPRPPPHPLPSFT